MWWRHPPQRSMMKNNTSSLEQTIRRVRRADHSTKGLFSRRFEGMDIKPTSLKTNVKQIRKIDGSTTSFSMNRIKDNVRIRVEKDVNLVLKNMKLKKQGQHHDEMLLTTDRRLKHWKANEDRIILENGLLFRKYHGETGIVKKYQILIPKQFVNEVLQSLHGEVGRHPRLTKLIVAYRKKYCHPNMATLHEKPVLLERKQS